MAKRNLYLKNTPADEAQAVYMQALDQILVPAAEQVPVPESLGRITVHAVSAKYCSPLYNAAAMDGIAVTASRTEGASERTPVILSPDEFITVDTGDPVRDPWDAVVMAEDVTELPDGSVRLMAAAAPWQHVRPIGEDIVQGEMLVPGHHRIRPVDIGVLLAGGVTKIGVFKKPKVAIFPTGTEIIEPGTEPKDGDIIESNSRVFEAMVREAGGDPERFAPIPDDYNRIRNAVDRAVDDHDLVIINAGSSAGTEDYTVHILRELGEVLIHGVAVKPGKPVILAVVRGKPVIGLPGYPVSAWINFRNFVTPVLDRLTERTAQELPKVQAVVSKRLVSSLKYREYVRVKVGEVGGKLVASPLARGAGAAMSLVRADGFCVIPQNSEGVEAGDPVEVDLFRSLDEIRRTAVIIGSHDLILDIVADMMPQRFPGYFISSTHVGSLGGLMALRRGEAHITPTHLLDPETGVYNIPTLKKLFSEPIALVKGLDRIQGIMVQKGNPLGIRGVEDLPGVRYVNRQRGAGTRVLLDYRLQQAGIDPESIRGYDREVTTHMAVAAQVASGAADAGMGIESAARAMHLDFVEVGPEEYDFAIPVRFLKLPQVQDFLQLLHDPEFRKRVLALGGYAFRQTGKIIYVNGGDQS